MCAAAVFPWTAVPSRPLPAVIEDVVRTSGSDPVTVMVTERETLTAPLEVPPNVTLWFVGGGLLQLESRLDLRGPLLAPPRPIFEGDGEVRFRGGSTRSVCADWWGAGHGTGDHAITAMASSIPNGARAVFRFTPGRTYRLESTARLQLQNHHAVIASGAQFLVTRSGVVGVDINPRANPAYTERTVVIFARWEGGRFFTEKEKTVALRALCFRNLVVDGVHIEGFAEGIEWSAKDTIRFKHLHLRKNLFGAVLTNWATDGTVTIDSVFEDCHFAAGGMRAGIRLDGPWHNLAVRGGSVNGGGANLASIHVRNEGFRGSRLHAGGLLLEGVHFEQGTQGTRYLWVQDEAGTPTVGVHIRGNTFGHSPPIALQLERVQSARLEANTFAQTRGVHFAIDNNCSQVTIDRSNFLPARGTATYPLTLTGGREGRVTFTGGGKGRNIASATRIELPDPFATAYVVTGSEGIEQIDPSWPGRQVTLRFNGGAVVRAGGNLLVAGEFSGGPDRQLTLVCEDGQSWREVSRSFN